MFELLTIVIFIWLMVKAVGLAFRLAWGAVRIFASILMAVAVPVLIVCVVFLGGMYLLAPVALIGVAAGILKACVS